MNKVIKKIAFIIPHPLLLVFFFLLHAVNENFGLISLSIFIKYSGLYLLLGLVLLSLSLLFFKKRAPAFLYASFLLAVFFFFGAVQDTLKNVSLPLWMTSYTMLLSAIVLLAFAVAYVLKKAKSNFSKLNSYLQLFFLIITAIELITFTWFTITNHEQINEFGDRSKQLSKGYQPCDSCSKPDIYFIVFDGYASSSCLRDEFNFDNSSMDSLLGKYDFFISKNSKSNYALSPLSIASAFDLNYLRNDLKQKEVTGKFIVQSVQTLYNSELPIMLGKEGYEMKNYSIFNFKGHAVDSSEQHAAFKENLINLQTLAGRFKRDIGWRVARLNPLASAKSFETNFTRKKELNIRRYITSNFQKLESEIKEKSGRPKFVYAHLMLPHDPYYFDDNGHYNPDSMIYRIIPQLYIKQLVFTNKLVTKIVDDLMNDTARKKIVIIEGDHGYREYLQRSKMPEIFRNLNAYWFPDKNYSILYDGISPVNTFRVVFNQYFHKNFPLLPDSSVYIKSPDLSFEKTKQ